MDKAPADEDSDKAAPVSKDSRSYPTFRNIGIAEVTSTRQCKEKSFHHFPLHCPRLFVTLALPKLLRLGKVQINLAFLSTFRNFALK